MKRLVQKTEQGFKPICSNCIKHYMCNGPSDCVNILLETLYEYENGYVEYPIGVGEKVKVCRWDELRDRCVIDMDDILYFNDSPITTFSAYDSKWCEAIGTITKFDQYDPECFYLDITGDMKWCETFVKKVN